MLKTLVALALVVAVFVPAGVAFADQGDDTHADHPILVSNDVPAADLQSGAVAGSDKVQGTPYFELRLDNMGQ